MGSIHIGHELYGQKPDNNFIFTIFNSTSSSNEPQEVRGNQVEYKTQDKTSGSCTPDDPAEELFLRHGEIIYLLD